MTTVAVLGAVVVAFVGWYLLFGRGRDNVWPRSWAIGSVLIAYSLLALAWIGRLDDVVGPVGFVQVGIGIAVGVTWLVATHIGHAVLRRLFPSFVDQIKDLYGLGAEDPASRVVGPLLVMAVAEELLFRGLVHGSAGFAAGVALYTLVQFVERKWALALAALLGGVVWGGLYEFTDGLVAPVVAHALWTITLTLVWPLGGRGNPTPDVGSSDPAPLRSESRSPFPSTQSEGRHA